MRNLVLFLTLIVMHSETFAAKAIFAGGCFWCMEAEYQDLDGVSDVISGFTGGTLKNPTYSGNHRGHYEAVEITYDPDIISYKTLIDIFWHNIDPFDAKGQFCDKGPSYRSAVFTANERERKIANESLQVVQKQFSQQTVATEILNAGDFWPVVESHQDYYKKNPLRYRFYRSGCGRDRTLKKIWGDAAGGH
ncbi:MAG: peptide-methionine (S)-S-oxide reductase MsrA [Pseudomonadales bacterium]|nr:peptide-methionine (S)-S-oxide reductase MsrA [Pseudomonadales bacterium]